MRPPSSLLPFSDRAVWTEELFWLPGRRFSGDLANHVFVDVDTKARTRRRSHMAIFDLEDGLVFQIGVQVNITGLDLYCSRISLWPLYSELLREDKRCNACRATFQE